MTIQQLTRKLKALAQDAGLEVHLIRITHSEHYKGFPYIKEAKHQLSATTFYTANNEHGFRNFIAVVNSYKLNGPELLVLEYQKQLKELEIIDWAKIPAINELKL